MGTKNNKRFDGKLVITMSRREEVPVEEIGVGKFTDWVKPHRVAEGLCCNVMAGYCQDNTVCEHGNSWNCTS